MTTCAHGREDHESCVRCAMVEPVVIIGGSMTDPDVALATKAGYENGVWSERRRCRAIVSRIFGNDWNGNEALGLIDGG